MYVRSDLSLFRNLTTLGQKAGVQRKHLGRLVMKELTDNALDAGANVKVGKMTGGWHYVEDDGPGIGGTNEEVASLFSFGRPLTSSKLLRLPTRGALGNGLRVVAGAVCASGGKLRVRTGGRWLILTPEDNGTTRAVPAERDSAAGTRVEIKLGSDLADDDVLVWANLAVALKGETAYKGRSSPWWYGDDDFFELLQAHDGDLTSLLKQLEMPAGVVRAVADSIDVDEERTHDINRAGARILLSAMRSASKEIAPSRLGVVGQLDGMDGYAKETDTFTLAVSASGDTRAKLPCVVEVWAKRREKGADPSLNFFVNRTQVPEDSQVWLEKAELHVHGCGLGYKVKTGRAPMCYWVNIQTPYMPITTDGKAPNLEPCVLPILNAIKKASRRAARATRSENEQGTSKKDVIIANIDQAIQQASGDDTYRFSLRQLYYAVRPLFQEATGSDADELDYNHFASVITDYEQSIGHDIPKMYRDARGTLYHPHTGETIPLGTLNVEAYKRPEWTFNKVLYCEKEGFFPLLLDEKWPERHDCALLTSKGFASRAARDVIDLLGDSDEELLFFAIHDADGPGTKILEALQEATRARPARRVRIVDLGLNPWEAVEMRLQAERVNRKGSSRVPVAQYVRDYTNENSSRNWEEWLQTKRVELNAMSSPAFLKWLSRKMAEHDQGKVVPPGKVLSQKFHEALEKEVRERVTKRILVENKADDQIDATVRKVPTIKPAVLEKRVREALKTKPAELWSEPLGREAADAADKVTS